MHIEKQKITVLILYFCLIFTLWAALEFLFRPQLELIDNKWITTFIWTAIIKNCVWTLPAIYLIKRYSSEMAVPLKEMFTNRVNWLRCLPIFAVFTVYTLASGAYVHGRFGVSPDFIFPDLLIVLFVGLTEELVFRGWLLNAVIKDKPEKKLWPIVMLNAVLFLIIHFPKWLYEGDFITSFTNFNFICVLGLSVLFSWTFIKSKNLLLPIFLHMYWDLLIFLFV